MYQLLNLPDWITGLVAMPRDFANKIFVFATVTDDENLTSVAPLLRQTWLEIVVRFNDVLAEMPENGVVWIELENLIQALNVGIWTRALSANRSGIDGIDDRTVELLILLNDPFREGWYEMRYTDDGVYLGDVNLPELPDIALPTGGVYSFRVLGEISILVWQSTEEADDE